MGHKKVCSWFCNEHVIIFLIKICQLFTINICQYFVMNICQILANNTLIFCDKRVRSLQWAYDSTLQWTCQLFVTYTCKYCKNMQKIRSMLPRAFRPQEGNMSELYKLPRFNIDLAKTFLIASKKEKINLPCI